MAILADPFKGISAQADVIRQGGMDSLRQPDQPLTLLDITGSGPGACLRELGRSNTVQVLEGTGVTEVSTGLPAPTAKAAGAFA